MPQHSTYDVGKYSCHPKYERTIYLSTCHLADRNVNLKLWHVHDVWRDCGRQTLHLGTPALRGIVSN